MINVRLKQKIDCTGFDDLVGKVMGKWGSIAYSIITLIFLYACMIAYLIIGGDMITAWFAFGGIDISEFKYRIIMILIYAIVLPVALMYPKNFFFLGVVSTFSLLLVIFYIIASIVRSVQVFTTVGIAKTVVIAKFDMTIFSSLGVYSLAFCLPTVVIPLLHPFSPKYKKRRNVVLQCFIITALCSIVPSILMYLIFGDDVQGNVLNSFSSDDVLFTLVRIAFFIIVNSSFPVLGKGAMCNWSELLFKAHHANLLEGYRYWIVFILAAIIPILFAMFLPQVKPAISVGGALGGCLASFGFPPILWIMSSGKKLTERTNILCAIFATFGIFMAAIATYQSVVDAINAFKTTGV